MKQSCKVGSALHWTAAKTASMRKYCKFRSNTCHCSHFFKLGSLGWRAQTGFKWYPGCSWPEPALQWLPSCHMTFWSQRENRQGASLLSNCFYSSYLMKLQPLWVSFETGGTVPFVWAHQSFTLHLKKKPIHFEIIDSSAESVKVFFATKWHEIWRTMYEKTTWNFSLYHISQNMDTDWLLLQDSTWTCM